VLRKRRHVVRPSKRKLMLDRRRQRMQRAAMKYVSNPVIQARIVVIPLLVSLCVATLRQRAIPARIPLEHALEAPLRHDDAGPDEPRDASVPVRSGLVQFWPSRVIAHEANRNIRGRVYHRADDVPKVRRDGKVIAEHDAVSDVLLDVPAPLSERPFVFDVSPLPLVSRVVIEVRDAIAQWEQVDKHAGEVFATGMDPGRVVDAQAERHTRTDQTVQFTVHLAPSTRSRPCSGSPARRFPRLYRTT